MALIFVGTPDLDPDAFLEKYQSVSVLEEGEVAAYDGYDQFLFFKKKKPLSAEEKAAKRQKRKDFWANLGKNVKEGGGAEGLGRTIDNITRLFGKGEEVPEDYTISLASTEAEYRQQGIPTSVFIIGGALLLGMAGLGYVMYVNKQKA
ncbi:hypothetical protein [Flavilitoribacter nigricans]|uniref:Uncharacterized protein n=1 Tax=Flavilitoribacter nigricans (strain ATCC 23147 / DSM 23189 / NBRC 102662 / NCIMB 1420 / SS-2) TaxID=1122177 RepID=A0A2D0MXY7_FLAN2|nr:hypothetical protein [Flavilitoribacter nigricans]PHN01124.1 hypothetical protein CRP01_38625 [Flavilitoribacter nigricans DSM 23189 = NBRC 102662]